MKGGSDDRQHTTGRAGGGGGGGHAALDDVDRALNLLDAPAQPPGETVTLAMWRNPVGGVLLSVAGTKDDHDAGRSWTRLGTVTLAVTP